MNSADRILGGITFLAGVAVWLLCGNIAGIVEEHALPPSFFPRLLAAVLAALGLLLLARGGGRPLAQVWQAVGNRENLFLVGVTLVYCLAFGSVDYRLSTPLYILAAMWALGARKPLELVLLPLGGTAVLYGVFRYGFQVLLPTMG